MCRVLGCVAAEPVSLRHELLEAENPMIRQSEHHDSGWGMAVYNRGAGDEPRCVRFPEAAFTDNGFVEATELKGRIFNAHVRRATMGGLVLENTHPFCLGPYSFCHNGTVLHFPRLLELGVPKPAGNTDSEHMFNYLITHIDRGDVVGSLRRLVAGRDLPLPVLRAQLPVRRRRAALRLPARHLRAALAPPAGAAARCQRADHGRAVAQRGPGRAAHARPRRHRGAARRAPGGRRRGWRERRS